MDHATRMFQQSLCPSRSVVDNLDPTSARIVNDLQKQVDKLKGDVALERNRARSMARDHLVELKRLREEHEQRLESSLEAQNIRKNNEKMMEIKKLEESIHRERDAQLKTLQREKTEEIRLLEKRLLQEHEEKLRYALEQERRMAFNEAQAQLPDEEELVARETKLAKEVFSLGGENMRLEDQIRHLSQENRSQIDLIRRMKKEHELEIEGLLRKTKTEAARDSARLKLGEQIIQEREAEFMDLLQRAEYAENESSELRSEVSSLKASLDAANKMKREREPSPSHQVKRSSGNLVKQIEDLEFSVKKLDEEKSLLKHDNASLRKKLFQEGGDSKISKDQDEKMKRLRKRNADLVTLTKTLEERCKILKQENTKMQDKHLGDNTDVEQQIRKTLARQHAKDISDYTRKIASRDREIMEIKRKLSKYEGAGGTPLEVSSETSKKFKTLSIEKLRMEKLIAKLYSLLPSDVDVELTYTQFSSEAAHIKELSEENDSLRRQINELRQPSEIDGGCGNKGRVFRKSESTGTILQPVASELDSVRDLRDENQRLNTKLEELSRLEREHVDVTNQLVDMQLAASSSEKKLKLVEEDLEQARVATQEYELVQEHCRELENEVAQTRGALNEKDRDIYQLELENKTFQAHVKEKEEEIDSLKEQISSLKNELNQGEMLVKDLQTELEKNQLSSPPPDTSHVSMQTSPLFSPKRTSPKSSQTSPLFSPPKSSPSIGGSTKLKNLPEYNNEEETLLEEKPISDSTFVKGSKFNNTGSDLHSEMSAVGVSISDPYDSEGPLTSNNDLTDPLSETSDVGAVSPGNKTPPTLSLLAENDAVSLYIACEDYFPLTMSPNPDSDVELTLKRGDYVYILGEPDDVGFFMGQLANGKKGLVPSNYVKKLTDNPFQLFDSNHVTTPSIPPPLNLELNRQFVQDDAYSLAIHWEHPKPLPPNTTGYNVYTNGVLDSTVKVNEETFILLSGVPRNQYIYVSVRTVVNNVMESSDPSKLVEINPQYPEVPTQVSVKIPCLQPLQLHVSWRLYRSLSSSTNTIYTVILNDIHICNKTTNQIESLHDKEYFITLTMDDFNIDSTHQLTPPLLISLQASNDHYTCPSSVSVSLPAEIVKLLCSNIDNNEEIISEEIISEEIIEEETSLTSVSNGIYEEPPSITDTCTTTTTTTNNTNSLADIVEVIVGDYYRAVYSYDPSVNSPNDEGADEELAFYENDIITAVSELDEDGFFVGSCHGKEGLVPKNHVEHITDLENIKEQQHEETTSQTPTSGSGQLVSNGNHSSHLVQALYDYNPSTQSPNMEYSEELGFDQGDYITVFGDPIDGFYEGELKGQRGYVPKSFVTPVSSSMLMKSINEKISHTNQEVPFVET